MFAMSVDDQSGSATVGDYIFTEPLDAIIAQLQAEKAVLDFINPAIPSMFIKQESLVLCIY